MKTVMQTIYIDYRFDLDGSIENAIGALQKALHAAKADGMIEGTGVFLAEDNAFNYSRLETEEEQERKRIKYKEYEERRNIHAAKMQKQNEDNERALYERLKAKFGDEQ